MRSLRGRGEVGLPPGPALESAPRRLAAERELGLAQLGSGFGEGLQPEVLWSYAAKPADDVWSWRTEADRLATPWSSAASVATFPAGRWPRQTHGPFGGRRSRVVRLGRSCRGTVGTVSRVTRTSGPAARARCWAEDVPRGDGERARLEQRCGIRRALVSEGFREGSRTPVCYAHVVRGSPCVSSQGCEGGPKEPLAPGLGRTRWSSGSRRMTVRLGPASTASRSGLRDRRSAGRTPAVVRIDALARRAPRWVFFVSV